MLKQAGYKVGFAGKFGFSISDEEGLTAEGEEGNVAQSDFDYWAGAPGQTSYKTAENEHLSQYANMYPHSSRAYGAASIDFIDKAVEEGKPFCMSVYFKAPHRPVEPDPKFDAIYEDTKFRKLPNYGRKAGEHLAPQSRMGRQYDRFEEWGYDTKKDYQEALRKYHQLIYGVDYSIGMILNELKALGVDDNTVIIFSSDNGYYNGSHGFGSKALPYEEGARVPLIISDPRNKKSKSMRKSSALTGNVDITATILDLAGVPIPTNYDGVSLMPLLLKLEKPVRASLPIIQVWGGEEIHSLTVLDGQYKYIYWYFQDEKKELKPTEELFDILNDPYEMENLAGESEYAVPLAKLRDLYDDQIEAWKKEGVKYNNYEKYGVLLDRNIAWHDKELMVKEIEEK